MTSTFKRRMVDGLSALLPQRFRSLPEQTSTLSNQVEHLSAELANLTERLRVQREGVDRGYQVLLEQLAEMDRQRGEDRAELTSVAARARLAASDPPPASHDGGAARASEPDIDNFYSGFEERFRGDRQTIQRKLAPYVSIFGDMDRGDAPVLDIGPGRCEWLGLLHEAGLAAYGIDINPRFVELGESLGVDVRLGDAVEHLRRLPDQSLAGVTAFQVAEHLPTAVLFDLVEHALRALRMGGAIILETPNPLNLEVGAAEFWIDPTHRHPLHPRFLEYLLINRGFVGVEVRTANAPGEPFDISRLGAEGDEIRRVGERLNEILFSGADYAVIGRRAAASA